MRGSPLVAHLGAQHLGQGGFAEARGATEQHHLPEALLGLRPASPQQPQFFVAPHQEGHAGHHGLIRMLFQRPEHPEHRHRLGHPFEGMPPAVL
jgi:hypothetical protein